MITNLHPNSCPTVVAPLTTKSVSICNPWEQKDSLYSSYSCSKKLIRMANLCLSARSVGE